MPRERWRTIPILPDYEVSNQGKVRRRTPGRGATVGRHVLIPVDSLGYPNANLGGKPRRIHVLVAAAFIDEWTPDAEVHHVNGDKTDNRLENLEVCTSRHAHRERHRGPDSERRRVEEPNPCLLCECGCGEVLLKFDNDGRPRRFVSGHNLRLHSPAT